MTNDYAMFSNTGNEQVHLIVETVKRTRLKNNEAWSLAYNELDELSGKKGFEEAMDTDVRDHVYFALQRQKIINDLETDFFL